ncbi:MAG: hypothetical protein O7C75_14435, partial [Verrucomicrobia bacterium]|nr:hypothetical protein [Verrucomicrobiota bacterium]
MHRTFLLLSLFILLGSTSMLSADWQVVDDFDRANTRYHGDGWESLSPGYWKIENQALRRRLKNLGNRNPITNFPWHWSHGGKEVENRTWKEFPDLPIGMIWRRDWSLTGNYSLRATVTIKDLNPEGRGEQNGYFGLCFGGESLFETREFRGAPKGASSWMAVWEKEGLFKLTEHGQKGRPVDDTKAVKTPVFNPGEQVYLEVEVYGNSDETANITVSLEHRGQKYPITREKANRAMYTDGFIGLAAYGSLDFEINRVEIDPGSNKASSIELNELHVAYPLGDSLQLVDGKWSCKFITLFRSDGEEVSIRIADTENPRGGW